MGSTIVLPTSPVMSPRPAKVKVMFSLVRGRAEVPPRRTPRPRRTRGREVEVPLILGDDWEEFLCWREAYQHLIIAP